MGFAASNFFCEDKLFLAATVAKEEKKKTIFVTGHCMRTGKYSMCNNFAQIRKQHHLEKIPGKESENLYEHTILEIVKIPKMQNVTCMIWLSYYSRWQT